MALDLTAIRADTMGCDGLAHFNNAGASLPPNAVVDTVITHLRREQTIGGYEAMAEAADRTAAVYNSVAKLIGGQPSEIAYLESATKAWDLAFYGFRLQPGDRVLVDRARYPSYAVSMIQVAHRRGAVIEVVQSDHTGQLDLDDLVRRLDTGVKLVALTHIPTDSGLINPIAAAGAACRAAGVPLLVDACQSVGQLAVDVEALQCDMLTSAGRKFLRGPRGTGFLWVRESWLDRIEPLVLDTWGSTWTGPDSYQLAPTARRFESFERSVAVMLGLGAAADYALDVGMPAIEQRVLALGARLRAELAAVPGVRVHHVGAAECGIVCFTVDTITSLDLRMALAARGINTSVTMPQAGAVEGGDAISPQRVRASVHYYNTEAEIEALATTVAELTA